MGYIEETGAAQYLRDVRITTIYEGTTGIQSNDLLGRKLGRDKGAAMASLLSDMASELQQLAADHPSTAATRSAALEGVGLLRDATQALLVYLATRPELALSVSVPYLELCGFVVGGWLMAKSSAIAASRMKGADAEFYSAKVRTALFYAEHLLPSALMLARVVQRGGPSVAETDSALV